MEKKIKDVLSERIYYKFIITFLIALPLVEIFTEFTTGPYLLQPELVTDIGMVGLLILILKIFCEFREKRFVLYKTDIFFVLLLLFSFISFIFTTNKSITRYGDFYDELFTHFIAYYVLMLIATFVKEESYRLKIIYAYVLVAIINDVVGVFQSRGYQISYCMYTPGAYKCTHSLYVFTQNSNWYGALSVILLSVCLGCYIFSYSMKKQLIFGILTGLSFFCSLCSKSRAAWVGNFMVIIFYFISLKVMKNRKLVEIKWKKISILIVIYFLAAIMAQLANNAILGEISRTFQNVYISYDSTSKDENRSIGENIVQNIEIKNMQFDCSSLERFTIWKYGLESVPKHWLTGIGLDNYESAFYENPKWHEGMPYQGKGHNEYIHTLVTQGVFAIINYLALLFYSFFGGVKTVLTTEDEEERRNVWILLGMFIGYAAQAFFNSSVINVAPYFWIVVGLTRSQKTQKPIKIINSKRTD